MKNIFLILFSFFAIGLYAQSGVNTQDVNPNSALHIEAPNKDKGLIIPRLTKAQRDAIPTTTAEDGLTIYNVDEDCVNYWSKVEKEWKSVCGKLGKATFTFNCLTDVTVEGTLIEGREVNTSNFLSVKVNVTRPGEYTILGSTTNGYSFYHTGTFLNTGIYTIRIPGQGTPKVKGIDNMSFTNNGVATGCVKQVEVLSAAGTYTMRCGTATPRGVYKVGVALTTDHFIELPIMVDKIGSWSITSNTVDGISFKAAGTFFTTGPIVVKLYGQGTPISTTKKTMTLTSNSLGEVSTTCSVDVIVVIPKKRILALGLANTYGYTFAPGSASNKMLTANTNFGTLPNSVVKYEGFAEIIQGGNTTAGGARLSEWLLGSNPVDIMITSYDTYFTADMVNVITQYLAKGGVVISYGDRADDSASNILLRGVLSDPSLTTIPSGGAGTTYQLSNDINPFTNGPFGNISGKYWGEDASTTASIPSSSIDRSINVLSRDSRGNIIAFSHTKFNFLWVGDGGFNSNNASIAPFENACPFKIDVNNFPISRPRYGYASRDWGTPEGLPQIGVIANTQDVYNAVFTANAIAWAIERAESNGINKK